MNTPSSESEPERVKTEAESSSAEEVEEKRIQEMDKRATQALEEGGVLDRLVNGLALMTESEREKMMQVHEAAMLEELKKMSVVAGKATTEKMVEERAGSEEKKEKDKVD